MWLWRCCLLFLLILTPAPSVVSQHDITEGEAAASTQDHATSPTQEHATSPTQGHATSQTLGHATSQTQGHFMTPTEKEEPIRAEERRQSDSSSPSCKAEPAYDIRLPPQICVPSPATVKEVFISDSEENFTEPCIATSTKPIRYTWTRDGEDIPANHQFIKFDPDTGVLSMPSGVTAREEGDYRCLASNTYGTSLSQIVRIRKTENPPFPKKDTKEAEVVEHDGIALECRDKPQFVPDGIYSWYIFPSGSEEGSSQLQQADTHSVGADGTLYILSANTSYYQRPNHVYACGVQNKDKSIIVTGSRVDLTVKSHPSQERRPTLLGSTGQLTVEKGETALLECFFSGVPLPKVTWKYLPGRNITSQPGKYELPEKGLKLKITEVTEDDEGRYQCTGQNKMGFEHSVIFLNVTSRPIFEKRPDKVITPKGTDATFTCSARPALRESPLAPPQWMVDGKPLASVTRVRHRLENNGKQLTFLEVTDKDVMCVQCIVSNERGDAFAETYLTVIEPLAITEKPESVIQVDRNQSSVSLTISASGDACCPLEFSWYLGEKDLPASKLNRPPYSYSRSGNNVNLTISLENDDNEEVFGQYRCYVWHAIYNQNNNQNNYNKNVTVLLQLKTDVTTEPTQAAAAQSANALADMWWLAIVLGVVLLIVAAIVIFLMIHFNYPREEYLLEKEEIRHKLNPERDLLDQSFTEI